MNTSFELLEAFGLLSELDIKPSMVSPKRELLSPIISTNNFQWNYDLNNNSIENRAQKPSLKRKRGSIFNNHSPLLNRLPIDLPSTSIGIKIESSSSSSILKIKLNFFFIFCFYNYILKLFFFFYIIHQHHLYQHQQVQLLIHHL